MNDERPYRLLPNAEIDRLRADARLLMLEGSQNDARDGSAAAVRAGENFLKSVIIANGASIVALVGLADKLKTINPSLHFTDLKYALASYAIGLVIAIISFGLAYIANHYISEEHHTVYSMMSSGYDGMDELSKKFQSEVNPLAKKRKIWAWAMAITASIAASAFMVGIFLSWKALAL